MHKTDFPIFTNNPDLVYLDSAATAQKPAVVLNEMQRYLTCDYANIHRGQYDLSEKSELLYRTARKKVADFLGATDEEVLFTSQATDSINKLVKSLIRTGTISKGDKVLLSELEHHANIIPRQIAAQDHGIILEFVGLDEEQQIDLQDLQSKCDSSTKVVSLTMVSNVTGGITKVAEITKILEQHTEQALFIVDASQAMPHIGVDVTTLGADALFFTGHKLGALNGIGVLRGKKNLLEGLIPAYGGGGMIEEVTHHGFSLQPSPDKFEPGTPNVMAALSLKIAIEYIEDTGGYAALAKTELPLMTYCLEQFALLEDKGVTLLGPKNIQDRVGVFSFLLPIGKHPTQLGAYMAEHNVCIRCGAQCAHVFHAGLEDRTGGKACIQQSCRISLRGYNDISDVRKFFHVLHMFLGSQVSS